MHLLQSVLIVAAGWPPWDGPRCWRALQTQSSGLGPPPCKVRVTWLLCPPFYDTVMPFDCTQQACCSMSCAWCLDISCVCGAELLKAGDSLCEELFAEEFV